MTMEELVPPPEKTETFEPKSVRFVPERPGCYTLTTFSHAVLYIGRTINLRARMKRHLRDEEKVKSTRQGRATFFSWIECDDIEKVERTWVNIYIHCNGRLPVFNSIYPTVST